MQVNLQKLSTLSFTILFFNPVKTSENQKGNILWKWISVNETQILY